MTSEKAAHVEARLDRLVSNGGDDLFGPWTQFNPLSNSWAVKSPFTNVYVRRAPGNNVQMSALMTPGTSTDLTTVGTIPANDADGNGLRPAQTQDITVSCDALRIPGVGTNQEGASFRILTDGTIQCFGVAGSAIRVGVNAFYSLDSL